MNDLTAKEIEKELDRLTSEIVILRDKKCVQCSSTYQLGAGHVFPRRVRATRWNINTNVFTQCQLCNHNHNLVRQSYYDRVKQLIGQGSFEANELLWNRAPKLSYDQILEKLNTLTAIRAELNWNKSLGCTLTYPHHEFINGKCYFCNAKN